VHSSNFFIFATVDRAASSTSHHHLKFLLKIADTTDAKFVIILTLDLHTRLCRTGMHRELDAAGNIEIE